MVIQWYKIDTMVIDVLTCVRVPTVIELISLYRRKIICSQLLIRVPSLQASVEKSVNKIKNKKKINSNEFNQQ